MSLCDQCVEVSEFDVSCTRPLNAFKSDGKVHIIGKSFKKPIGGFKIPCGQCAACRLRHAQDWAIRCMHERQTSESSCFITLTYAPENVPDNWSVDVEEWKRFAKRLRKLVGPFRFLACGEYGEESSRPHYHACLFGVDFSEDRELFREDKGYRLYRSPTLEKAWKFGYSLIGDVTFESASYVARYVMKKQSTNRYDRIRDCWVPNARYRRFCMDTGELWEVKPEFATMSRAYGLGTDWFHRYWNDVYPADRVVVEGRELRPPVFYDKLAESLDSVDIEAIKETRRMNAVEIDQSRERLEAKEICLEQRLVLKRKSDSL